ncbi:LOW QUALITY PROTEIN: uncharacterized protein LOC108093239 [Drosophila ficusphila]|uniref:LOW QUALITY PROTEIN: uncharacterized protein LOC108093239 n=1 Tax=Drosophila ficusphila TaxID=30025 RepID=UPI0007E6AD07|nr:LOW QUALITY PROTEIN: uncharacterized protein LOC108093239 [Drosophila ficusphila]
MDFNSGTYDQKYFNFTAAQLSAEREHIVQDIIKKGIAQIIERIKTPATSDLLESQRETVEHRFQASAAKGLKVLRELDKKVFHVPPHVLHPEHMFFENQFTSEEEDQKTARLEELKAKYRENAAMLAHLKIEEEKYAAMEDLIQKEMEMHDRVHKNCSSLNVTKMKEYCSQIAGQLEKSNENLKNKK